MTNAAVIYATKQSTADFTGMTIIAVMQKKKSLTLNLNGGEIMLKIHKYLTTATSNEVRKRKIHYLIGNSFWQTSLCSPKLQNYQGVNDPIDFQSAILKGTACKRCEAKYGG